MSFIRRTPPLVRWLLEAAASVAHFIEGVKVVDHAKLPIAIVQHLTPKVVQDWGDWFWLMALSIAQGTVQLIASIVDHLSAPLLVLAWFVETWILVKEAQEVLRRRRADREKASEIPAIAERETDAEV